MEYGYDLQYKTLWFQVTTYYSLKQFFALDFGSSSLLKLLP